MTSILLPEIGISTSTPRIKPLLDKGYLVEAGKRKSIVTGHTQLIRKVKDPSVKYGDLSNEKQRILTGKDKYINDLECIIIKLLNNPTLAETNRDIITEFIMSRKKSFK
jgi:hypothetical protein